MMPSRFACSVLLLVACAPDAEVTPYPEPEGGSAMYPIPPEGALEGFETMMTEEGPVTFHWYDVDGFAITHGDIILGRTEDMGRRSAPEMIGNKWPGGVIYYTIDAALPNQWRVTDAMEHMSARTGLVFTPRTNQANYVYYRSAADCSSSVGMVGGRQYINLHGTCLTGAAIHETMHAAGIWHEQQREDREEYINVLYNCIINGQEYNFDVVGTSKPHGAYDFNSIMHYPAWAFADGSPGCNVTMEKENGGGFITQEDGMSTGDVQAIEDLYGWGTWDMQLVFDNVPNEQGTSDLRAFFANGWDEVKFGYTTTGAGPGPCPPPLEGDCLDLTGQPKMLGKKTADTNGIARLTNYAMPLGTDVNLFAVQAVVLRSQAMGGNLFSAGTVYQSTCIVGDVRDCLDVCSPISDLGDGVCDENFNCAEYGNDVNDC